MSHTTERALQIYGEAILRKRSGLLPASTATGPTVQEVERDTHAAIRFHAGGPREDGLSVPAPTRLSLYHLPLPIGGSQPVWRQV